jgi:hypothetical protein
MLGDAALIIVGLMLTVTMLHQFRSLGRFAVLSDALSFAPQWKFFAQPALADSGAGFDDLHLSARRANGPGAEWVELFTPGERHWLEAIWNPQLRVEGVVLEAMTSVALAAARAQTDHFRQSCAYLTLLRHSLAGLAAAPGCAIQFAVVTTRGRDARELRVAFLSAWHVP